MEHAVEQYLHGDDRGRDRQHDLKEEAGGAAAVHARRFQQFVGNGGGEEGAGDDQVDHVDGGGQHHGAHGVEQPEVAHQQVERDQAAVEQHGEHNERGDHVAALEVAPRQGVAGEHGEGDVERRADPGVDEGVAVADEDVGIAKHPGIALQGEPARVPGHLAGVHQARFADRGDQHEVERVHQRHQDQRQDGQVDGVEYPVGGARPRPAAAPRGGLQDPVERLFGAAAAQLAVCHRCPVPAPTTGCCRSPAWRSG